MNAVLETDNGGLKAEIFALLERVGASYAHGEFSGSGDSGFVEDVTCYRGDPPEDLENGSPDWNQQMGNSRDLDRLCDDLVSEHYDAWYDGDGGHGVIWILPGRDQVLIRMWWYVEHSEPAEPPEVVL